MLVLSRNLGQSLDLGKGVKITVVKVDGRAVRIGIEAPEHVSIKRQEIAFEMPESFSREVSD